MLDGAVRPLLSSSGRAQAGSTATPPGRGLRIKGADMGWMRRTRSEHLVTAEVPRGQREALAVSAGCPGRSVGGHQRRVRSNVQAVSWTRGPAGRYAATALGALAALALGVFVPAAAQAAAPATLYVSQGGLDSGTCTSASPCATVSYALTQAASGATIEVSGTIDDHVSISSPVTITTWPGGPSRTAGERDRRPRQCGRRNY
jgi:hypothetical protein